MNKNKKLNVQNNTALTLIKQETKLELQHSKKLIKTAKMDKKYKINYHIFAKQKRELELQITLNDLTKLNECINSGSYTFNCNFFFFEENSTPTIKYNFTGIINLICQITLEIFPFEISAQNTLAITNDDRFLKNDLYEPFICETDILDLRDIIKEEVILAIPLVPKKDSSTCKMSKKPSYYSEQEDLSEKRENPFDILKELKKR
nr:DUF177 domain-containing protein [Pseudofrancisella aestuarii]